MFGIENVWIGRVAGFESREAQQVVEGGVSNDRARSFPAQPVTPQ